MSSIEKESKRRIEEIYKNWGITKSTPNNQIPIGAKTELNILQEEMRQKAIAENREDDYDDDSASLGLWGSF